MSNTRPFVPPPSRIVPINPDLKCGEEWNSLHLSCDDDCDDEEDDDDFRGPINFHITLPDTTTNGNGTPPHNTTRRLNFNCRDKSSGVLLPTESKAEESELEDDNVMRNDPFFFEKGFYLEAKTGFQPWPSSRLMVEAFTCCTSSTTTTTGAVAVTKDDNDNHDNGNHRLAYWQSRLRNGDLTILEVGAGIGLVGTCLAAAGGKVWVTDLPVLVEHAIWPNLRRNGKATTPSSLDALQERAPKGGIFTASSEGYCSRIGRGWAQAATLDWFQPISEQLSDETTSSFDVIVACDCFFLRKTTDPLLSMINSIFQKASSSSSTKSRPPTFLFTYQRRNMTGVFMGLEELLEKMERRGWNVECLAWRTISVEGDGEQDLHLFEASPAGAGELEGERLGLLMEEKKQGE
mmetsp:Transcript_4103/g.9104  ORF Transcript_4103/g.9104 Transcript_4103/m.9104 type:complete len:405 (+) Transcript_4103:150-1364(+)